MNPKNQQKGQFVTVEGIDGSGKSTAAKAVVDLLNRQGCSAVFINKKQIGAFEGTYLKRFMSGLSTSLWGAHPGDPVGSVPESAWLYLHSCWYYMLQDKIIRPAVDAGRVVVIDGWYYKFLARHLENGNFDFDLSFKVLSGLDTGDPIFLLDIEPERTWARRAIFSESELGAHAAARIDGSAKDRFMMYQSAVRARYLKMSEARHWQIVRGDEAPGIVADRIARVILTIQLARGRG